MFWIWLVRKEDSLLFKKISFRGMVALGSTPRPDINYEEALCSDFRLDVIAILVRVVIL